MRVAIIGDYDLNRPSHVATLECLRKTGSYLSKHIETKWLPTLSLEARKSLVELQEFDGVWGAPGDHDSSLGMINAIRAAREQNIPYLGT